MDNFIKDIVFSIYDNELIKSKEDLQIFLKKFIKVLQTYEYESIDLNETSEEEESDSDPTTSDEEFIFNSEEESESESEESLNGEIFICDICKNGC